MELRDLEGRAYIDSGWAGFSSKMSESPSGIWAYLSVRLLERPDFRVRLLASCLENPDTENSGY
jgi:hypothetical protein